MKLKKIVIIGPESTGKSTLCEQLATHYKTHWLPEYAREYILKNGNVSQFETLYEIAKGQLKQEDNFTYEWHINRGKEPDKKKYNLTGPAASHLGYPLFIDTDMYVMKVWSEIAFNKCDNRILTQIAERSYDLYLLCNTDLPWVKDSLREYPDLNKRKNIYQHYKDAMVQQNTNWVEITGNYEERLNQAIHAVESILH